MFYKVKISVVSLGKGADNLTIVFTSPGPRTRHALPCWTLISRFRPVANEEQLAMLDLFIRWLKCLARESWEDSFSRVQNSPRC